MKADSAERNDRDDRDSAPPSLPAWMIDNEAPLPVDPPEPTMPSSQPPPRSHRRRPSVDEMVSTIPSTRRPSSEAARWITTETMLRIIAFTIALLLGGSFVIYLRSIPQSTPYIAP